MGAHLARPCHTRPEPPGHSQEALQFHRYLHPLRRAMGLTDIPNVVLFLLEKGRAIIWNAFSRQHRPRKDRDIHPYDLATWSATPAACCVASSVTFTKETLGSAFGAGDATPRAIEEQESDAGYQRCRTSTRQRDVRAVRDAQHDEEQVVAGERETIVIAATRESPRRRRSAQRLRLESFIFHIDHDDRPSLL